MSPPLLSRRTAPTVLHGERLVQPGCGRMRFSVDISQGDLMRAARPTSGAFNQGGVPTIACFNKASTPLGVDFDALIAAFQEFVDRCVMPVWGPPANLSKSKGYVKGASAIVFRDNHYQQGALTYQDLTPDG